MKLRKIKKTVLKQNKLCMVEAGNGAQWVGTDAALYSLDGMPYMQDGQICRLLDISPDKAATLSEIAHYSEYGIAAYEADDNSLTVKDMDDEITINDCTLAVVTDDNGRTVFFDPDLIAPVKDADLFKLTFDNKLLAFEGLFLVAIIMPMKPGENARNRMLEILAAME